MMIRYTYQIRQCNNDACGLRYPLRMGNPFGLKCPRCTSSTRLIHTLGLEEEASRDAFSPGIKLEALLDNVRSAWNVGSIFRSADGVGLRQIHLCGITPTPENPQVEKTSLGAEKNIAWNFYTYGVLALKSLQEQGKRAWALESGSRSESIFDLPSEFIDETMILVVGNEKVGVDPDILGLCERSISIPMAGAKRSLNVAVAFGIAAYLLTHSLSQGQSH